MTFGNAVASCLLQYTSLSGRASRSEFWYFVLCIVIASVAVWLVSLFLPDRWGSVLQALVLMASAIPLFSVFVRRLHDIGAPTWRALFLCVPVVHLVCLYWALKPGTDGDNEYGEYPD